MMEMIFVLVEPGLPENVGAAARAMKTMGFTKLRLVNPCDPLCERARWMAHGSHELLDDCQVYDSLARALEDVDLTVGTTARRRFVRDLYYTPDSAAELIRRNACRARRTAVVFGREKHGLTNQEIRQCDILVSIPMRTSYPSLNLAQAVMVIAYAFSPLPKNIVEKPVESVEPGQLHKLKAKVSEILDRLDIQPESKFHSRIMERLSVIDQRDCRMLHTLCKRINGRIFHS